MSNDEIKNLTPESIELTIEEISDFIKGKINVVSRLDKVDINDLKAPNIDDNIGNNPDIIPSFFSSFSGIALV